jgi:hypothetical protein
MQLGLCFKKMASTLHKLLKHVVITKQTDKRNELYV